MFPTRVPVSTTAPFNYSLADLGNALLNSTISPEIQNGNNPRAHNANVELYYDVLSIRNLICNAAMWEEAVKYNTPPFLLYLLVRF
jgi:hypothetical protein